MVGNVPPVYFIKGLVSKRECGVFWALEAFQKSVRSLVVPPIIIYIGSVLSFSSMLCIFSPARRQWIQEGLRKAMMCLPLFRSIVGALLLSAYMGVRSILYRVKKGKKMNMAV